MGEIGNAEALSVIRPFMGEDHDNEVRLIAIQTAGLLRDSAILEELKSVATDEEDDEIRIAAVIAIGHLGDKTGLNFLEPLLDDENDEIIEAVSAAIELLNKPEEIVSTPQLPIESHDLTEEPQSVIVDEAGLDQLFSDLGSEDNQVRIKASRLLVKRQPIPFERLLECLDDENPLKRAYTAETLGLIGDEKAIPYLRQKIKDIDPTVQAFIGWALGNCKDPEYIPIPKEKKPQVTQRKSHYSQGNYGHEYHRYSSHNQAEQSNRNFHSRSSYNNRSSQRYKKQN